MLWPMLSRRSLKRFLRGKRLKAPAIRTRIPPGVPVRGTVIMVAGGNHGLAGNGKMAPHDYLPPFAYELQRHGLELRFATSTRQAERLRGAVPACFVHVFNEEGELARALQDEAATSQAVFNAPRLGEVVTDKTRTNALLRDAGIAVPRIATPQDRMAVFSNANDASGAPVNLIEAGGALDPARYNTELIDTRHEHEGRFYHVSLRLMSVGRELVQIVPRARDDADGSPSVHARNTPLDPDLIKDILNSLVRDRLEDFRRLSAALGDALGPGFFAHDVLSRRGDGKLFVNETGFKFHNPVSSKHLRPIEAHIPVMVTSTSPRYVRRSARAFLAECRRLQLFGEGVEDAADDSLESEYARAW